MKIEVGKTYVARSGTRITICSGGGRTQPFVGKALDTRNPWRGEWSGDGTFYSDGTISSLDLVMEMGGPLTTPKSPIIEGVIDANSAGELVTPWFPPEVKPVRPGEYDTVLPGWFDIRIGKPAGGSIDRLQWSGYDWRNRDDGSVGLRRYWRGLATPPAAEKVHADSLTSAYEKVVARPLTILEQRQCLADAVNETMTGRAQRSLDLTLTDAVQRKFAEVNGLVLKDGQ